MIADAVRLEASVLRPEGRPVLFLHGFGHNRHVWSKLAHSMRPEFRPILIELRGHGDSDWSIERQYETQDYARDLPVALDALGLDRVAVVGHSLGGLAAILFAAAHPERVESLVLVDTGPKLSMAALTQITEDMNIGPQRFDTEDVYREWLSGTLPFADPEEVKALAAHSLVRRLDGAYELKLDPGAMTPNVDAARWRESEMQISDALKKIRRPALLVRGGLSAVLPEPVAREIVDDMLVDGRLETLERAGHAVMLDDGPGLLRVVERFFNSMPS
jgi:esterase